MGALQHHRRLFVIQRPRCQESRQVERVAGVVPAWVRMLAFPPRMPPTFWIRITPSLPIDDSGWRRGGSNHDRGWSLRWLCTAPDAQLQLVAQERLVQDHRRVSVDSWTASRLDGQGWRMEKTVRRRDVAHRGRWTSRRVCHRHIRIRMRQTGVCLHLLGLERFRWGRASVFLLCRRLHGGNCLPASVRRWFQRNKSASDS